MLRFDSLPPTPLTTHLTDSLNEFIFASGLNYHQAAGLAGEIAARQLIDQGVRSAGDMDSIADCLQFNSTTVGEHQSLGEDFRNSFDRVTEAKFLTSEVVL